MRQFLLWVLKVLGLPLVGMVGLYFVQRFFWDPVGNPYQPENQRRLTEIGACDVLIGSSHVFRQIDPQIWEEVTGRCAVNIAGPAQFATESLMYLDQLERSGLLQPGQRVFFELTPKTGLGFSFRESYFFSQMEGAILREIGLKDPFLSYFLYDGVMGFFQRPKKAVSFPMFLSLDGQMTQDPEAKFLEGRRRDFLEHQTEIMDHYAKARAGKGYERTAEEGSERIVDYLNARKALLAQKGVELIVFVPFGGWDADMESLTQRGLELRDFRFDAAYENPDLWFDRGHLNAQGAAVHTRLLAEAFRVNGHP